MKLGPPNVGLCLNGVPEICAIYPLLDRQRPLGPVDPSFRALSGRLKLTVRRHKFNKDSLRSDYRGTSLIRNTYPPRITIGP